MILISAFVGFCCNLIVVVVIVTLFCLASKKCPLMTDFVAVDWLFCMFLVIEIKPGQYCPPQSIHAGSGLSTNNTIKIMMLFCIENKQTKRKERGSVNKIFKKKTKKNDLNFDKKKMNILKFAM